MKKIFDWRNQFWGHQFRRRKRRWLHFCESVLPRARQYLTPSFRNPLKQRGKSVSFQIRSSAHFYRNWDIASLPRKLYPVRNNAPLLCSGVRF
jgi:hypothetical protein